MTPPVGGMGGAGPNLGTGGSITPEACRLVGGMGAVGMDTVRGGGLGGAGVIIPPSWGGGGGGGWVGCMGKAGPAAVGAVAAGTCSCDMSSIFLAFDSSDFLVDEGTPLLLNCGSWTCCCPSLVVTPADTGGGRPGSIRPPPLPGVTTGMWIPDLDDLGVFSELFLERLEAGFSPDELMPLFLLPCLLPPDPPLRLLARAWWP